MAESTNCERTSYFRVKPGQEKKFEKFVNQELNADGDMVEMERNSDGLYALRTYVGWDYPDPSGDDEYADGLAIIVDFLAPGCGLVMVWSSNTKLAYVMGGAHVFTKDEKGEVTVEDNRLRDWYQDKVKAALLAGVEITAPEC